MDWKKHIQAEIQRLQGQLGSLEEASQPIAPDVSLGRLTRMDAIQSKSISEATLYENRSRITALKVALDRVDAGVYMVCSQCGTDIPPARLEYMLHTTTCVDCAE